MVSDWQGPSLQILDSTLREGELFRFLPAESRMRVASKIADSGVRLMEVTVDYPRRTSYEDNVGVVKALKDRGVEVVVHGRATQEDMSSMARYDAYGCAVYIAVSELHREFKLHGITREAAVERLVEAVSRARGLGFRYIRATMEDASRLFLQEGEPGLDFVRTSAERLRSAGATVLSLPDTSGLMTTGQARDFFRGAGRVSTLPLSAHFHNDYGFASANTVEAVLEGAQEAQVSVMGVGDRNGIADLYEVVASLEDVHGVSTGVDRRSLRPLYSLFSKAAGVQLPWRHPLSEEAQTVRAGVHQSMTVRRSDGYIPSKKLAFDFGEPLYAVGPFVSHSLVQEIVGPYGSVGPAESKRTAEALARRFSNGAPSVSEVGDLIMSQTGVSVPRDALSRYFARERLYVLLRLRPQYRVDDLLADVSCCDDVESVDEVYGDADVVILARALPGEGGVLSLIKRKYSKVVQEMRVLVAD